MINKENKKGNVNIFKEVKEYIICISVAVIIAVIFHTYVFARANVDGPSMQPTLQNKDVLFIEKVTTQLHDIKRGEIVVFDSKNQNNDNYIKRVIAVAGDKVEIKNDHVYLNGQLLKENYLDPKTVTEPMTFISQYIVPEGYVFVLGDNRTNSTDSRILGPINIKDIKGHAVVRVFPFNKLKVF